MNYYNQIKNELISNEIYKKVKDYSKNKNDLNTYYKVGKLLNDAGKHYGEKIIEQYSIKLIKEIGKKYNKRTLFRMRQFYRLFSSEKLSPIATQLSWSHYIELLSLKRIDEVLYYINISVNQNLSRNELREKIKNNEYKRINESTKNKIIDNSSTNVTDYIKNPILVKNSYNYTEISEKVLKKLILEDLSNFLTELGDGFCFIKDEYKIRLGSKYNYIDLLLFNIKFNCYVVVELKVTELKKEHIGQIEFYMNYIDKNVKTINHEKTIGIIIVKKDNNFILEYASDTRIYRTIYNLI